MSAPSVQMSQALSKQLVAPAVVAASAFLSPALDISDFEGVVAVSLNIGAVTGAITFPSVALTNSDTAGGVYDAVSTVSGAFTPVTANGVATIYFNANSARQFLKFASTITGTSAAISVVVTGFKKYRP